MGFKGNLDNGRLELSGGKVWEGHQPEVVVQGAPRLDAKRENNLLWNGKEKRYYVGYSAKIPFAVLGDRGRGVCAKGGGELKSRFHNGRVRFEQKKATPDGNGKEKNWETRGVSEVSWKRPKGGGILQQPEFP